MQNRQQDQIDRMFNPEPIIVIDSSFEGLAVAVERRVDDKGKVYFEAKCHASCRSGWCDEQAVGALASLIQGVRLLGARIESDIPGAMLRAATAVISETDDGDEGESPAGVC